MTAQKFSQKEALGFGWRTLKSNFGFFIALFAGIIIISLGLNALQNSFQQSAGLSFVIGVAAYIINILISIGLIEVPLRFMDGKKAEFGDVFSGYRHAFNYFVGSFFYLLVILGGLILLVVPGIIWALRFQFFGYLIVDKGLGPVAALKQSWAITAGETWNLFTFSALLVLINIAGLLAFFVGLFITAPLSLLALAFVYRKLSTAQPVSVSASTSAIA